MESRSSRAHRQADGHCATHLVNLHLNLTGKQLLGGGTQLDLLVDLEGQVRLLLSMSADAESRLQGHAFHVVRQIQYLQNVHSIRCRGGRTCD